MSGTVSMYLRTLFLQLAFVPESAHQLDQTWVGLTYDVAAANIAAEQLAEPTSGGYSRAPYAIGGDYWQLSGFSEILNSQEAVFPAAEADWGRLYGWTLTTAQTGGVVLAAGQLIVPTYVEAGMQPVVPALTMELGLYD